MTFRAPNHRGSASSTPGRRLVSAVAVLAMSAALLMVGFSAPASAEAAHPRHWTLAGVAFTDGGRLTGSFVLDEDGHLADVHLATSGGGVAWFGENTFDATTASISDDGNDHFLTLNGSDPAHFLRLVLPELAGAGDGAEVELAANTSYECINCSPYRYISTGWLVASSKITIDGTPTISGVTESGNTLSVDDVAVTTDPADATRSYEWLRDGASIDGATGSTYDLTPDDVGHLISVKYGATKYGYPSADAVTTSAVGPITLDAPTVGLSASKTTVRRGQSVTLTWNATDVAEATASGGWTGTIAPTGTLVVKPTKLGRTTYRLDAVNDSGMAGAAVSVNVIRPAKAFKVNASDGPHARGSKITVSTRGLEAGEGFTIRIAGTKVATGKAAGGPVSRTVTIPMGTRLGMVNLTVTGSVNDRVGKDQVKVVAR